jgi:hypothetical protein
VADQQFLVYMEKVKAPIVYLNPCPKKQSGSAWRYLRYMFATTLTESLELGSTRDDLRHDYRRGFIRFSKHESDLPGHVFAAFDLAAEHGLTHILQDVDKVPSTTFRSLAHFFTFLIAFVVTSHLVLAYFPGMLLRRDQHTFWRQSVSFRICTVHGVLVSLTVVPQMVRRRMSLSVMKGVGIRLTMVAM